MILNLFTRRIKYRLLSSHWFKSWAKRIYRFPQLLRLSLIRFTAKAWGAQIGRDSILEALPAKNGLARLFVGSKSFISKDVNFAMHGKISIGNNVVISSGTRILTASHSLNDEAWTQYASNVTISDYAWIATDALILPGVHIGTGAVVGAGAVVREDVPNFTIVVGNPATPLKKKRVELLKYDPTAFCSAVDAWLH